MESLSVVIMPSGVPADLGTGALWVIYQWGMPVWWLCALPVSLLQEPVSARAAVFWRLLLPSGAIPVHGRCFAGTQVLGFRVFGVALLFYQYQENP